MTTVYQLLFTNTNTICFGNESDVRDNRSIAFQVPKENILFSKWNNG